MNEEQLESLKDYIRSISDPKACLPRRPLLDLTEELIDEVVEEINIIVDNIILSGTYQSDDIPYITRYLAMLFVFGKSFPFVREEERDDIPEIEKESISEITKNPKFFMLMDQLVDVLNTLTDREQKVLKLRFGLEDGRVRTLGEVGKELDVNRERIRQIEVKAFRKIRHPVRSDPIKSRFI